MKFNFWILLGGLIIRLIITYYYQNKANNESNCSDLNIKEELILLNSSKILDRTIGIGSGSGNRWNCYVGHSYYNMRDTFQSLTKELNLELHSYYLPNHPTISTDAVVIEGSPENKNIIMHMSGTHGPEGYAGSAIQIAFLKQLKLCKQDKACNKKVSSEWPTIVLVHAVNAFGFAYNRRFTEENVDLNRYFVLFYYIIKCLYRYILYICIFC